MMIWMQLAVFAAALHGESGVVSGKPLASSAQILKLAERASWSFCHQPGRDGCQLEPVFFDGKWTVMASPWILDSHGKAYCCVVDGDRIFRFSTDGAFLGEELGGP